MSFYLTSKPIAGTEPVLFSGAVLQGRTELGDPVTRWTCDHRHRLSRKAAECARRWWRTGGSLAIAIRDREVGLRP